jgi:hypothetical protein
MTVAGLALKGPVRTVPIRSLDGSEVAEMGLPRFFSAPLRADLVRRVYLALLSHQFQPKGGLERLRTQILGRVLGARLWNS